METVKARDEAFPPEFREAVAAFPSARDGYEWIYGSVVKFSPAGGAVWFSGKQASPLTYEGWGAGRSVAGLRTSGGSLVGTVAKAPARLHFPGLRADAGAVKSITMRLKNDSPGEQATFSYHHLREGYIASCGPGFRKTIPIAPNSDFTLYTFDMAGDQEWRDIVHNFALEPVGGAQGGFSLDWVRIGGDGSKLTWNFDAEDNPDTKLPASLPKELVGAYRRPEGATLQGALWWRGGFSPLGDLGVHNGCHCTGSDFDVDDFGRVFAPDTGRFRIGVLDTAGNEILSFGAYGNQDSCGPDIAFAWIIGLAVTDRYAYVSDVVNKRVLRIALDYTVQEVCDAL
jgi:hypothetical protein